MHCPTFAFALAVPSVWNTLPTALWEKSFKTYCLSEGFLELPVFATIPGWPPPIPNSWGSVDCILWHGDWEAYPGLGPA